MNGEEENLFISAFFKLLLLDEKQNRKKWLERKRRENERGKIYKKGVSQGELKKKKKKKKKKKQKQKQKQKQDKTLK